MISSIKAKGFSLLRDVEVALGGGLTVLTGESGAGKSLLFDAVNFALGGRTHRSLLAEGAENCEVQLQIELDAAAAERAGAGWHSGANKVARSMSSSGRSRQSLNGKPVGSVALQSGVEDLIEITGQFESRILFDQQRHVELLDAFGDEKLVKSLAAYSGAYAEYVRCIARLRVLHEAAGNRAQEIEFLHFHVDELGKAAVRPGERQETEAQLRMLQNAQQLISAAQTAADLLAGGEDSSGAYDLTAQADREIQRLVEVLGDSETLGEDPRELAAQAAAALESLQDLAHRLRALAQGIQHEPAVLNQLRERLDEILRLERKYGVGADELEPMLADKTERLEFLLDDSQSPEALEAELARLDQDLRKQGAQITKMRTAAGKRIISAARRFFDRLDFPHVELAVEIEEHEPGPAGVDRVEFLVSLNPGEPTRPLAQVASGGEASRLLLALKAALAERSGALSLLLDEIEAGLGGQTAEHVADVVAELAQGRQIVAITHLPLVAVRGSRHLLAQKRISAGRTRIEIGEISGQARRDELARMIGGADRDKILELVDHMLAGH